MIKRKLSKLGIRRRRLKYLKKSKVFTPGSKKPHKKEIDKENIDEFKWKRENFGTPVKFKGGKRKRKGK